MLFDSSQKAPSFADCNTLFDQFCQKYERRKNKLYFVLPPPQEQRVAGSLLLGRGQDLPEGS